MQTVTVKLPADLAEELARRSRRLNRPKSEIVRRVLRAEFNGEKGSTSLLARAGDLVGKYASGRKDSSDKRRLKTLGLKSPGQWKRS